MFTCQKKITTHVNLVAPKSPRELNWVNNSLRPDILSTTVSRHRPAARHFRHAFYARRMFSPHFHSSDTTLPPATRGSCGIVVTGSSELCVYVSSISGLRAHPSIVAGVDLRGAQYALCTWTRHPLFRDDTTTREFSVACTGCGSKNYPPRDFWQIFQHSLGISKQNLITDLLRHPTGWPKHWHILFCTPNFVKYWPIFKLISPSESGEHLQ